MTMMTDINKQVIIANWNKLEFLLIWIQMTSTNVKLIIDFHILHCVSLSLYKILYMFLISMNK